MYGFRKIQQVDYAGYHWIHRWLANGNRGSTGATRGSRMVIEVTLEPLVARVLSQG